ncbi:MAG: patatin-like phospholipase family protein [Vallitalea sp.]|jgi:patatin-like phospholipase/acyl hydrolase|nr:patatin-like phospholipase family protein [Vallitalea sp.]
MKYSNTDVVKILSIDGGGVRGLIPCMFLSHLRKELDRTGNTTSFHKLFNIISGTSTGSIISLMLIKPPKDYSDNERLELLLDLYENKTKLIFPEANHEIAQHTRQFFRPKYNGKQLKKLLRQNLKDYTLDDSLTNLIVPTYDMRDMSSFLFKHNNSAINTKNFLLKDVALASSAAPTYLPPANIRCISTGKSYCFVDGGIYCNNPSLCAYTYAKNIFPNAKKYLIISLGTGSYTRTYKCKNIKKWGILGWMNPFNKVPLLSAFMDSQIDSDNYVISNMADVKEYRFEVSLDGISSELDDSSDKNIEFLKGKASELILAKKDEINKIVKIL